jgi:RNA methyltransferase, TrmH family
MLTANSIKFVKSLQNKKHRKEFGLFVAEGPKLVLELIESNLSIETVYYTINWEKPATAKAIKYELVSPKEMERISGLTTPSSVLAVIKIPNQSFLLSDLNASISIALDDIQDPGNLGTIIRLADWFGLEYIFCSNGTVDAFSPKVVQSTMGAISRVKIVYVDLATFFEDIKKHNIPISGTFLDGENIYNSELPKNGIIVLGNEGNGISEVIEKHVNQRITIPSFTAKGKGSESLNVAMATAIICSEFKRRIKA